MSTPTARGGPRGFDDAYTDLFIRAMRAARRVVRDVALSEDIAAETLARAYARWGKVEDHAEAWVTRVAVNLALDATRRSPVGMAEPKPDEERTLDRLVLDGHLARLPQRQRQAVVLRFVLDLDERETARVLGVSVSSVHTHVKRGLGRLRLSLADDRRPPGTPGGPDCLEGPDYLEGGAK